MSKPTREAVFAALFAKLAGITALKTSSRTLKSIQDMNLEELPAAFQTQGKQVLLFKGSTPTLNDWTASWIFYASSNDAVCASTVLNDLVDAACSILSPPTGNNRQTLGGIVEYATIVGDIEIFEGLLGDKAIAIIPIKIVLGGF